MTLMIQLVGEQYLPNVLPVRHYHPEHVLLVYTEKTKPHFERLKQFLQNETHVIGLQTDAYNIALITDKIERALNEYYEEWGEQADRASWFFNLTGGTKAMILGAHQLASDHQSPICYLQSEGAQSVIYYYEWTDGRLTQKERESLPAYLTLRDMLNLAIGKEGIDWKEDGASTEAGGLFETAIVNVLRKDRDYEVMCGVRIFKDLELDVVIRYQNQLGILEAKIDGKARKLDGIQQLATAVRHLGTFAKQFFAINDNSSEESQKVIRNVSRIVLVPLLQYKREDRTLTTHDAHVLETSIEKSLKA